MTAALQVAQTETQTGRTNGKKGKKKGNVAEREKGAKGRRRCWRERSENESNSNKNRPSRGTACEHAGRKALRSLRRRVGVPPPPREGCQPRAVEPGELAKGQTEGSC